MLISKYKFNGRAVTFLMMAFILMVVSMVVTVPEVWSQSQAVMKGSPDATVGGLRRQRFAVAPVTLHPLNATGVYANNVLDRIYEALLEINYDTLDFIPLLTKSYKISKDKLTYTFYLDPRAKWSDGKPLTAEDVKFSLDILLNKKLKTYAKWKTYYSRVESSEVVNPTTVRFKFKNDHFLNIVNIGTMTIVPKHKFDINNPNKTKLIKKPVGSGAYRLVRYRTGQSILLERRDDYWGWDLPQNKNRFNDERILMKIVLNDKVALETFKKKELDILSLTAKQWVHETTDSKFSNVRTPKKPFVKLRVKNKQARGYGYVGWNLESPLFKDVRVRKAMTRLFDRKTIIEKFFFNLRVPSLGPFTANSVYSSPKVKQLDFSIPKAIALLKKAGWKDTNGDGIVEKDGKIFSFTVFTANKDTSPKILTITQENMRKAGVEMKIKILEWSTLLKLIDEYNYDAVMLGWSRSEWADPTALWHSKSAVVGGLNLVRYKNKEVDKLIDRTSDSVSKKERISLYRKIHELIYRDQPYTFLVESDSALMTYNSDLQQAQPWYNYATGSDYWWRSKTVAKAQ